MCSIVTQFIVGGDGQWAQSIQNFASSKCGDNVVEALMQNLLANVIKIFYYAIFM